VRAVAPAADTKAVLKEDPSSGKKLDIHMNRTGIDRVFTKRKDLFAFVSVLCVEYVYLAARHLVPL
jgi:hypothetical protein